MQIDWSVRAETAQEEMKYNFWNNRLNIMNQYVPCEGNCNDPFFYWWHAHVVDVLVDGYERTKHPCYIERIDLVLDGVQKLNGHTLLNNFYDDMEWMALALLRVYDAVKKECYKEQVLVLWESIKTAWNDYMGGGMAWKKDQLDYKNTVANAPASILSSRLYQRFKRSDDFKWAYKIYHWNKEHLVNPKTGFVWDGINRLGDEKIDYDWKYTYCQGVFIGAAIELYRITGDSAYLSDAVHTAETAAKHFVDSETGMLLNEGEGDCALFKGIFVRYLYELFKLRPDLISIRDMLVHNATILWQYSRDERGLICRSWQGSVKPIAQLSAQLSGLMLLEKVALLPLGPDIHKVKANKLSI